MRRLKKKPILFLCLLMATGLIGGTYAIFRSSFTKTNTFNVAEYNVKLEEDFNPSTWPNLTTKKVYIRNDGSAPVVVRMSYNEVWKKGTNTLNNLVNGENVVIKNWTSSLNTDWVYKDGWYYYKKVLDGKSEIQLLESIELNQTLINASLDKDNYLSYDYELSFNYESVQADSKAIKELWNQNVTINGKDINW